MSLGDGHTQLHPSLYNYYYYYYYHVLAVTVCGLVEQGKRPGRRLENVWLTTEQQNPSLTKRRRRRLLLFVSETVSG